MIPFINNSISIQRNSQNSSIQNVKSGSTLPNIHGFNFKKIENLSLFDSASRNHSGIKKLHGTDFNVSKDRLNLETLSNQNSKATLLHSNIEASYSVGSKSSARRDRVSFAKSRNISFKKK